MLIGNLEFNPLKEAPKRYKVYKLEGPQRQGVESYRILSRCGPVKHLKTQKTKYVKQKMYKTQKLPDISVCKTNLLQGYKSRMSKYVTGPFNEISNEFFTALIKDILRCSSPSVHTMKMSSINLRLQTKGL